MSAFEDFVNLELPRRPAMLTLAITAYDGDPSDGGAPDIVYLAPKGSFFLEDSTSVLWKKNSSSGGDWSPILSGTPSPQSPFSDLQEFLAGISTLSIVAPDDLTVTLPGAMILSLVDGIRTPAAENENQPGMDLVIRMGAGGSGSFGGPGGNLSLAGGIGGNGSGFAGGGGQVGIEGGAGGLATGGVATSGGGVLIVGGIAGDGWTGQSGGTGGQLLFQGGNGGNTFAAVGTIGGPGGPVEIRGGNGGTSYDGFIGGQGGQLTILSGNSGFPGTGGAETAAAGLLYLDTGTPGTSGAAPINIGTTAAKVITIGRTGQTFTTPATLTSTVTSGAAFLTGTTGRFQSTGIVRLMSEMADGGSAFAVIIDTTTAWVNTAATLLSLRTNNVEKAYFTRDGSMLSTADVYARAHRGSGGIGGSNLVGANASEPNTYTRIASHVALVNAASKICSIGTTYGSDGSTFVEKAFFDYLGGLSAPSVTLSGVVSIVLPTGGRIYATAGGNYMSNIGATGLFSATSGWDAQAPSGSNSFQSLSGGRWNFATIGTDSSCYLSRSATNTITAALHFQALGDLYAGTGARFSVGLSTGNVTTDGKILTTGSYHESSVTGAATTAFYASGAVSGAFQAAATVRLLGGVADGAAAVAISSDSVNTLANATAKIHRFRNNTTEKLAIDLDGKFISPVGGAADVAGKSAAMVLGTITVNTTAVTAASIIQLTHAGAGVVGNYGVPYVSAIVAGTSFTITSTNLTDTDTVYWTIRN